jgi:hypothetical protein
MQDEWVNVRAKLCNNELHAVDHEAGNEMNVTRQAI